MKVNTDKPFSLEQYESLAASSGAEIFTIGYSSLNRPIKVLKKGNGELPVLFISRIHGNEPATTEALLSFFHEYQNNKFTLYGIYLANPDGAALYEQLWEYNPLPHWQNAYPDARLNAKGVDINRDWFDLSQCETNAIADFILKVKPEFAVDFHEFYWSDQGYPPHNPLEDNDGFLATMTDAPFFGAHEYVKKLSEESMYYLSKKLTEKNGWVIKHRHFIGAGHDTYENPAFLGIYLALRGIPKLLVETWGTGCSTLLLKKRIEFHKTAMSLLIVWLEENYSRLLGKPRKEETVTYDVSAVNKEMLKTCSEKLDKHKVKHLIQNNKIIINCTSLDAGFVKTILNLMFVKGI